MRKLRNALARADLRGWIFPTLGEAVMIAVIFLAGRCSAQQPGWVYKYDAPMMAIAPSPVVVVPVQPVAVPTYRPVASLVFGPTWTYHVAYVLRPPAPPAPVQPQGGHQ